MFNNNNYYQPEDDGTIDLGTREADLLKDIKPNTVDRLAEAIGEDLLAKDKEQLQDYLDNKDFENLGRKIWALNMEYWETWAENVAIEDYHAGLIGNGD
jgi:hypothetical protein